MRSTKYYTKIDLCQYFNQTRIQEGDEWKTAFHSRYGLFELLVMLFGLTNAPATAQRFMNDTLREFLDQFCVVYIDDILIYSKTKTEHREQVRNVLQKLKEAGLYTKPEKCEFNVEKTMFLRFIISVDGIEMDLANVEAVLNWETPNSVKDIQCFLGFANFYRRFINKYLYICQPLFNLLRKPENQENMTLEPAGGKESKIVIPFIWSLKCEKVFNQLKTDFTSALILCHFDSELETILECDTSDYVVSSILSQKHPNLDTGRMTLHPVTFMSEKMSPAECNYRISNKELLAIVVAFEKWHIYLHQLLLTFTIMTDHHNL